MGEYTYLRRDYDQCNWTKIEDCDAERYITDNQRHLKTRDLRKDLPYARG